MTTTSAITAAPYLVKGTTNNGVHTWLTPEAFEALAARTRLHGITGSYECTDGLLAVSAAGTFAFVDEQRMNGSLVNRVAGTLQQFNSWSQGIDIRDNLIVVNGCRVEVGNYVPFSQGCLLLRSADLPYIRTADDLNRVFGLDLR